MSNKMSFAYLFVFLTSSFSSFQWRVNFFCSLIAQANWTPLKNLNQPETLSHHTGPEFLGDTLLECRQSWLTSTLFANSPCLSLQVGLQQARAATTICEMGHCFPGCLNTWAQAPRLPCWIAGTAPSLVWRTKHHSKDLSIHQLPMLCYIQLLY